jgi:hypothetical protein
MTGDFPASYEVQLYTAMAPEVATITFEPPAHSSGPRLSLLVKPQFRDPWVGDFVGRGSGLVEWAHTPDPDHLLVVVGATSYWVNTSDPSGVLIFEDFFARSIHPVQPKGLLLLAGYSEMRALDGTGRSVWLTQNLASDGFSEVRVARDVVVVRGYQAAVGTELETTLSLDDGRVLNQAGA